MGARTRRTALVRKWQGGCLWPIGPPPPRHRVAQHEQAARPQPNAEQRASSSVTRQAKASQRTASSIAGADMRRGGRRLAPGWLSVEPSGPGVHPGQASIPIRRTPAARLLVSSWHASCLWAIAGSWHVSCVPPHGRKPFQRGLRRRSEGVSVITLAFASIVFVMERNCSSSSRSISAGVRSIRSTLVVSRNRSMPTTFPKAIRQVACTVSFSASSASFISLLVTHSRVRLLASVDCWSLLPCSWRILAATIG